MQSPSLKIIFKDLTSRYSHDTELIDRLWSEIEKAYTHKKRHYHTLNHLQYMVDLANEYRASLTDFDTILFSIFYHDFIYNISSQDNEKNSAEKAKHDLTLLNVPQVRIAVSEKQIMATQHHKKDDTNTDTNYLMDFDLAILGESFDVYNDYRQKVRKEYSLYPNFIYNNGRKAVLQRFLQMEKIFKTSDFIQRYEQQARDNLTRELGEL